MRFAGVIACAVLAAALPARALAANCNFSSNGIAFGSYDPTAPGGVRGAGTIDYDCSAGTWAIILINGGSSHDVNARRMARGPDRLAYDIFKDAGGANVWGDTWDSGLWTPLNGQGSVPVYGAIAPRQDVAAGPYSDTLTVTIIFL